MPEQIFYKFTPAPSITVPASPPISTKAYSNKWTATASKTSPKYTNSNPRAGKKSALHFSYSPPRPSLPPLPLSLSSFLFCPLSSRSPPLTLSLSSLLLSSLSPPSSLSSSSYCPFRPSRLFRPSRPPLSKKKRALDTSPTAPFFSIPHQLNTPTNPQHSYSQTQTALRPKQTDSPPQNPIR